MICSVAAALVLLMDVSGSVDAEEYLLQKNGTAAAFRSPEVTRVIEQQEGIAVTAIEWSDTAKITVNWMVLRTAADAAVFADKLDATERTPGLFTQMAPAFLTANLALDTLPCAAEREVVDISGDGRSDSSMSQAREVLLMRGATINAIVVPDKPNPFSLNAPAESLPDYFRAQVVTPSGFVLETADYKDYGPAIRRKLVLELASNQ